MGPSKLLAGDRRFQSQKGVNFDRFGKSLERFATERAHITIGLNKSKAVKGKAYAAGFCDALHSAGQMYRKSVRALFPGWVRGNYT